MRVFEWKPEYSVGDAELDREHRELFARADALHRAMLAGQAATLMEGLLKSLVEYTETHFRREEEWMAATQYADAESHRGEHNSFRLAVGRLGLKHKRKEGSTSVEIIQYLGNWLRNHILVRDQKIATSRASAQQSGSAGVRPSLNPWSSQAR